MRKYWTRYYGEEDDNDDEVEGCLKRIAGGDELPWLSEEVD